MGEFGILDDRRRHRDRSLARAPGPPPRSGDAAVSSVCLYTCSANPSGMGIHMLALAQQLTQSGLDVVVAYWPAPAAEGLMAQASSCGARPVRTPHPRDRAYSRELQALLRAEAPDVFHVHVGTGREDFGGARAARAAGVRAVVQTLHLPWLLGSRRKRTSFFSSLDAVDQLITVSQSQQATYERIGVPASAMHLVPNGVVPRGPGPGSAAARRELGLTLDQPVLMTVGRLAVQKGQRYLIDALPTLLTRWPDLVAVIIGEGHLREQLQRQAERLGVQHALRLVGHHTDAPALLDAADIFVLPSRQEAMPMAALEAMDVGLAVVGTRVVGTSEVVRDEKTGRLVRAGSASELGDAIAALLADPDLRRRYGEAGKRLFGDRFTAARMTADTLAVYEQTLARRTLATGAGR